MTIWSSERFFDAFCVIFRAPPVVPDLSASFSSPRGVLLPGDSAQGSCQLVTLVQWIYTHSKIRQNNNNNNTNDNSNNTSDNNNINDNNNISNNFFT